MGPEDVFCAEDAKLCSDGVTTVSRDPENDCEFEKCPDGFCTQEVQDCDDGTTVSRDPSNNCEFECPKKPDNDDKDGDNKGDKDDKDGDNKGDKDGDKGKDKKDPICLLEKEVGRCKKYVPRFYYDSDSD